MNDQDQGLQPLAQSLRRLTAELPISKEKSLTLKQQEMEATRAARVLLGCFRTGEANDPEVYTAAITATLARFPTWIIRQVADPTSGLPATSRWLPTVSEVRAACEGLAEHRARIEQMTEQAAAQIADRRAWEESKKGRPTYDDLKARYGENWGIAPDPVETAEAKAKRLTVITAANRRAFEAECEAAGMPATSPVSPSLLASLKKTKQGAAA